MNHPQQYVYSMHIIKQPNIITIQTFKKSQITKRMQQLNQVFQTKTHLHFGAKIYISCLSNQTKFYMYSNGISFKTVLSIAESQTSFDPSRCLFVITPIMRFQSEEMLESVISSRYADEDALVYDEKKTKAFIDQFQFQLQQNTKLKDQQLNFPLKYNENFMLQHVFSSKYLCFSRNLQNNQYTLQLSQIPTTSCIFSLKACFNYQKDINTYIPFNSAAFLNIKFQQGLQVNEMNLNFVMNAIFDSWIFSEENSDKINIELYQTGEEVEYKNICFGDSAWIFHLESGSFVKVIDQTRKSRSVILNKIRYSLGYSIQNYKQHDDDVIKSQIVVQKVENQMSAEKFGLWQILPVITKEAYTQAHEKGKFIGGRVKFDQQVRFFNIKYKAFLSVRRIKKGRNKFEYQYAMQQNQEQNTIFEIKSLSSNSVYVTTQDLFLVKNISSNTYLTLSVPFAVNQTQALLSPSSDYKKQDNFKFTKIDFLQLWQNNTLLSIMPFIGQGIRALKQLNQQFHLNQRDQVMLRILIENLIQLLSFSFDLTQGFQASQNKLGKMTYNHFSIQKLLREQGVINKMIQILDVINPAFLYQLAKEQKKQLQTLKLIGIINIAKKYGVGNKNISQKHMVKVQPLILKKIVDTSLKILRNCCKSNTENSLILFKHFKIIAKYLSLGTYAQSFFIDSFSVPIILQKVGMQQFKTIIDQYTKIFKITQIQSQKIFELLQKLIRPVDNKSLSKNQLQVYRQFCYQDNPLFIPLEQIDGKFYVKRIQLNQFCDEFPEIANVLGYQLKFLSSLAADRNYVCSKNMKQKFSLSTLLKYLTNQQITNYKIRQSFTWLIVHCYLNERPRFKKSTPMVFSAGNDEIQGQSTELGRKQENFQVEMKVMLDQGMSVALIEDIFSCVRAGDSMTEQNLNDLKVFIVRKMKEISGAEQHGGEEKFYTSKMEAYLACLKYLVQFSVFKKQQVQQLQQIIQRLAKKMDESLTVKKDKTQKLQSNNFRQLLLQMVQKNVIKKFNLSVKNDGIQDEVKSDNICQIYLNYSFYQNILLQQKDQRRRKATDSVIKIVLQLIRVYGQIKTGQKFRKFMHELANKKQIGVNGSDKKGLIRQVIIQKILQFSQNKSDVFNLLALIFYNSNSYNINSISLSCLLSGIFTDRLSMERITRIQINVDEKQKSEFVELEATCKSIKLLIETSQIWLNIYDLVKGKTSKYDSVILLFIGKVRRLLKIVMPDFDEQSFQPLHCIKYASSIIPQKQQIVSNLNIHEQFIELITEYRQLMLKIKTEQIKSYNSLLVPLFKFCFLFLFVYIYDSPENKNQVQEMVKEYYLRDYFHYVDRMNFGETMFIIEFLKNNYEECIQFYGKNPQTFQKYHKYTTTHSRLLLTTFSYYNQPIITNLRKFYVSIFDYTSFRTFLWFRPNSNQLNLDLSLYQTDVGKQPYLYHIYAIQAILSVVKHIQQSRNTIKQHIRKCLSQEYLYSLLNMDDFYTKQNSNNIMLKIMVHFKSKIMKLIQFAYFTDLKNDDLILAQMKRQNSVLTKFINESAARQQNQDFKKVILIKDIKQEAVNQSIKIKQLFENNINIKGKHILETYLQSIDQFCLGYKRYNSKTIDPLTERMVIACQQIHQKVSSVYDILHRFLKNFESQEHISVQKYPVPYQWIFSMSSANKNQENINQKRFFTSFLIQAVFNKQIYTKFQQNEKKSIKIFVNTLQSIHLKPFLFLQKLSEFIQDAFQKLSNKSTAQMYKLLYLLLSFMTLWIQCQSKQNVKQIRELIGKSQLVFPILNYFETCVFDKSNKQLFLICLQFFNQLIGEQGERSIQTIFNLYFKNKADSIEFFMKIKQLIDAINFQDRVNYKCKKIYDSIQQLLKDSRLEKQPQFIILNFLIRLCKGNFRDNQIFLSSLSNTSNFNIMSGIWQILKYQSQKYKKNLINVQNYNLISQCFSTIRQLVQGPCVQNQNQFLKRDFFLTVLDYFQFQISESDLTLERVLQDRLTQIQRISPSFTDKLRIYLNRDKITDKWMPSQVKYRCISLICSLLSENVNQQSKSQLYTISVPIIIRQLDRVYDRYVQLQLNYSYENLQVQQNTQIVLPLGFKLYELLQYYPPDKIPDHSPGLDFFRQNSRVVQVLHQKLCVVTFPRIPDQISQAFKNKFIQQVDRSSVNSKLRGLQDAEVQNKQSDFPYGYLLLVISILINIMDIIIYNKVTLGFIQFFAFYPLILFYGESPSVETALVVFKLICVVLSLIYLYLQARGAIYFKQHMSQIVNNQQTTKLQKFVSCVKFLWQNLNYFHYFITLILCIMALFNPFFDALFLLVQLYRRSETFSAIVDAITSTVDQLLVVLLLTLVCTYVLTIFLYFYRAEKDYTGQCQNLYHCFVFSLDLGFRADAAIVGFNDSSDTILNVFETYPISDVIVNFIYLFVIKVIIDQIIGAIIVDKFAALRQNKQKLQEDENSVCFICGLGRTLLDRQQDGFEYHKQQYHNLWNYFQFLIYIRKSKLSNLSGIQLFVYDQQKNGKLNWFPINRSYHLEEKTQETNQKQDEQNQLEKTMKILDIEFNDLREEVNQVWNILSIKLAKEQNTKQ